VFRSLRGQEFNRPEFQEVRSAAGWKFRRPGVPGPAVQEVRSS